MKFKPCSIIFFILVSFSSFGQNLNDDAAYFFYRYDKSVIKKNKIASLVIDLVVMDNKPGATKVHYFDKEGNLTKISDLDSNGVTKGEYFFFVNEHQDLVTRIYKDYELNKKDTDLVGTITYHYNPLGQLVLWKREKAATYSYTYNSKGLLTTVLMDMYVEPDAFMPEEIKILAKDIYRYSTRF